MRSFITVLSVVAMGLLAGEAGAKAHGGSAGATCLTKVSFCPKSAPCCSEFGHCGSTIDYCGGMCHQAGSYQGNSCAPQPKCKVGKVDPASVADISKYTGDANLVSFTSSGDVEVISQGEGAGEIVLKIKKGGPGASLKSTRFMKYGKVQASIKSDRGPGLVTSFITMSPEKDEIDWEWTGVDKFESQTNWFYRGANEMYTNNHPLSLKEAPDTTKYQTYSIEWTPQHIKFAINDKVLRTDTNPKPDQNDAEFPNTPSQVQFGIWNAGSQGGGTKEWAGGEIDWTAPEYKSKGYYELRIKDIEVVECYGASSDNGEQEKGDNHDNKGKDGSKNVTPEGSSGSPALTLPTAVLTLPLLLLAWM